MNKQDIKIIGEHIRNTRKKNALTLNDLAERVNCSPAAISQYERGTRCPSAGMVKRLAKALNCSISDWLSPTMWDAIQNEQRLTDSLLQNDTQNITDLLDKIFELSQKAPKTSPIAHRTTYDAFDFIIMCLSTYSTVNDDGRRAILQFMRDVQELPRFKLDHKITINLDEIAVPIEDFDDLMIG